MQPNGRTRLLTADEEAALGLRAQAGDLDARDDLVMGNYGLVASIVVRLHGRPDDELDRCGLVGLIEAADTFDPANHPGIRFSTHATYWIRMRVGRGMRDVPIVRPPLYLDAPARLVRKTKRARDAIQGYRDLAAQARRGHAHFACQGDDDGPDDRVPEPIDPSTLPPPPPGPLDVAADNLGVALSTLPEADYQVVVRHYGLDGHGPRSLAMTGRELGLGTTRVQQLNARGLAALRVALGCAPAETVASVA